MYQGYFAWDVLTTAYVGRPELFGLREWETAIITDGPSQGRTESSRSGRAELRPPGPARLPLLGTGGPRGVAGCRATPAVPSLVVLQDRGR